MRILVVDDDPAIVSLIKRGLTFEGYAVETAADGVEALTKARDLEPDLILLDIMMPGIDGISVSRQVRQVSDVPILMVTAKGTVSDRVAGLDSGADDYLVKPFAVDELLARVRALLRRRQPPAGELLEFGDLAMDVATREVTLGGERVDLTTQEFDLLELFLRHPRQVLKRDFIYERVWGHDYSGESNVIDVYVRYLRAKLEDARHPRIIDTVRGVGYVLRK
jgi:two-component system response regulator MprA